jgi:hypothetical protein
MESMEPCALATGLGSIRVLAVGELGSQDERRRLLVALTADGTVHGFDFSTFKPTLRKGQQASRLVRWKVAGPLEIPWNGIIIVHEWFVV